MSDPFAELDDLLNQIEKAKPAVKKEESKPPLSQNPKRQSQLWKNDLDNLLGEIATLDKTKQASNSNSTPPAKESKVPILQTSTNSYVKPATAQVATHKTTRVPERKFKIINCSIFAAVDSVPAVVGKMQLSSEETALTREINRARRNPKEYANILLVFLLFV